jgi:hypothetical protein
MTVRLTIKNYRCFAAPATIEVKLFVAFVGPNNAGKSALVRFPLEFRDLFSQLGQGPTLLAAFKGSSQAFGQLRHVLDQDEVFSNLNANGIEIIIEVPTNAETNFAIKAKVLVNRTGRSWRAELFINENKVLAENIISLADTTIVVSDNRHIDLHTLLNFCQLLTNSLYIGPFRNIINVGANENYYDIQVGDRFVGDFRSRKTGSHKVSSNDIARLIEDIRRIFEYNQLSIEPSADDKTLHITANGKPYKQHELGAGLSQFVVVLANIAIRRQKLILIDEPELNLHPRLQLDFLTTLANYGAEGVWFSTHSIGLARSAADKVYSVQRRWR